MTAAEMRPFLGTGAQWNALVASLPGAHLLQTWQWAQVKAMYGWEPMPLVWRAGSSAQSAIHEDKAGDNAAVAAAMILKRPVLRRGFVRGLCILYAPKGPLLDPSNGNLCVQVLGDLEALGRREGAILAKIDPDVELGRGFPGSEGYCDDALGATWQALLKARGWRISDLQVQFRNSVWMDLSGSEEELLGRMKQKSRYNIRLAERKGVTVRSGDSTGHSVTLQNVR